MPTDTADFKLTDFKREKTLKDFPVEELHEKERRGNENRRNIKWASFTKAKLSFGFQHLGPAHVPTMASESSGIALSIEKISGWSIPNAVWKEFGKGNYDVSVQLSLSLYHLASSSFFGSTWMGPPISLGGRDADGPKVIDFEYPEIIYLMSKITDPMCVGILEIVASKYNNKLNLVDSQFGCGWTILNLFKKPAAPDIDDGHELVGLKTCAIFAGSPRDLILNNDIKSLASNLKEIPDCSLFFKLFSHRKLLKSQQLIAENEVVGRFDVVPGLIERMVVPPGSTKARTLACIGDQEIYDDKDGVYILPAVPQLAMKLQVKIANAQVFIPKRRGLEIKMCESFARLLTIGDKSKVQIIARQIRYGFHNGNTAIGGDWAVHPLQEQDGDAGDLLMTKDAVLQLDGYVPNTLMALVVFVEYQLGVAAPPNTHFNSQTMVRATKVENGQLVTTFTLGAGVYIPCDGTYMVLRNTDREPGDEFGVDLEVPVLQDEICALLSTRPMVNDPSILNIDTAARTLAPGKRMLDETAQAKTAGRLSYVAGEKTISGGTLADPTQTVRNLELEAATRPTLGFDLKIFHPVKGEVLHQDESEPLLMPEGVELKRVEDGEGERRRTLTIRDREKKEDFSDTGGSKFKVSIAPQKFTRRDDEDDKSVADSLVTGDSERSSLRLDPLYYSTGKRKTAIPDDVSDLLSIASSGRIMPAGKRHTGEFDVPKNRGSLLAQSLQANLIAGPAPVAPDQELLPHQSLYGDHLRVATKTSALLPLATNAQHTREMSRGARARLNRHGFEGAVADTALPSGVLRQLGVDGLIPESAVVERDLRSGRNVVIDLDLEARDELSLHEISIQFAGYRPGSLSHDARDVPALRHDDPLLSNIAPRGIYCSYQFYTCMPTRTEIMRLLPGGGVSNADPRSYGRSLPQMCVLVRDEAHARNETTLTLQYRIDCSTSSPLEATEFAEYLAHCALYVDVWDADSLLLLGTCGIPLRKLMRQGQPVVKQALECDVINYELGSAVPAPGGIASYVVSDKGPISGNVVGALHCIISNRGVTGDGPPPSKRLKMLEQGFHGDQYVDEAGNLPMDGLNWRAYGIRRPGMDEPSKSKHARPKNSVRAKPLSERSPELNKALEEVRHSRSGATSYRSLGGGRGASGACTLTYDEVAVIFRRFGGASKGTVQYAGDLLSLLDLPSWAVAVKKLTRSYRRIADHEAFVQELLRHSNVDNRLTTADLQEALQVLIEAAGEKAREDELALLAIRLVAESNRSGGNKGRAGPGTVSKGGEDSASAQAIADFISEEADRHEWFLVGNKLRLCVQKATLEGVDVEMLASETDRDGTHFISVVGFRDFLQTLSKYGGKISAKDINLCCRHFSRRRKPSSMINSVAASSDISTNETVSLQEVMSFLGIQYVGNLQSRVRRALLSYADPQSPEGKSEGLQARTVLQMLRSERRNDRGGGVFNEAENTFSLEVVESVLNRLGVCNELSHEQLRKLLQQIDKNNSKNTGNSPRGVLSAAQILNYLGIPFTAAELTLSPREEPKSKSSVHLETENPAGTQSFSVEDMLHLVLEKVRQNGAQFDAVFRVFDANGDGFISAEELQTGLISLKVFAGLKESEWRRQMPLLVKKFDSSGDGEVSLHEFFDFLGLNSEYSPNITQRMTRIFAVAQEKNVSFDDIFQELDIDKNGTLEAAEILEGLNKIGTFGDISPEDIKSVVGEFDKDGDGQVSIPEFLDFFKARVAQVVKTRRRKRATKVMKRVKHMFAAAHEKVLEKGGGIEDIFKHLDMDKGGSVDTKELADRLLNMKKLKGLNREDVEDLVNYIDYDNSGDISMEEFRDFVLGTNDSGIEGSQNFTLLDFIRDTFKSAKAKGLSFQEAFALVDQDGSGGLTLRELGLCLEKIPGLTINQAELEELFSAIDDDDSGLVSISEFERFVEGGMTVAERKDQQIQIQQQRKRVAEKRNRHYEEVDNLSRKNVSKKEMSLTDAKELLIRHIRRIAQVDGSIAGLLAFLDDDEDGLIQLNSLKSTLRRNDVFDSVSETLVDELLSPMLLPGPFSQKGSPRGYGKENDGGQMIKTPVLLRFLEGKEVGFSAGAGVLGVGAGKGPPEDEPGPLVKEYEFSRDPEIRAVEKKIRGFGRVLAKHGVDVEGIFQTFDNQKSGLVRRTEFIEVLSKLGMYILEQGKVMEQALHPHLDVQKLQLRQIHKLKGVGGDYLHNAPRLARKMLMSDGGGPKTEFKDHLESMALVNWYRQGQKQLLLQRVLSHSLAISIRIYPRFGKTSFFEFPLTNPFGHEERFRVQIGDPELRLVIHLEEWIHLRKTCRPCVGELGPDPVEAEMFDLDAAAGTVQVALLPYETLFLPFAFLTLTPYTPPRAKQKKPISKFHSHSRDRGDQKESKYDDEEGKRDSLDSPLEKEEPRRVVSVNFVSGSHGHLVSVLNVLVCPRPFSLHRTLRFYEPEHTIMKRRVLLVGHESTVEYPGQFAVAAKYVHCVEGGNESTNVLEGNTPAPGAPRDFSAPQTRVVVEWGPTAVGPVGAGDQFSGSAALELMLRYRVGAFPSTGTFYLLIYNDPYQSQLYEIWQVMVHTRLKLDIHAVVGSVAPAEVAVRGDRFPRRVRAYGLCSSDTDALSFQPNSVFQLVPGAYNRVGLAVHPRAIGNRRMQLNIVDVDSRELISGWLVLLAATAPAVMRSYDVDVPVGSSMHKKIVFKNIWDVPKKFTLNSSDVRIMRPRTSELEVAPHGSAYIRLWFSGADEAISSVAGVIPGVQQQQDVHLFLNDAAGGHNEECYLFKVKFISG